MNDRRNHPFAHMSWGIPIFLFIAWWPAGLILTIFKIADSKAEEQENQTRRNWANQMNGQPGAPYQYDPRYAQQAAPGQYAYHPGTAPVSGQAGRESGARAAAPGTAQQPMAAPVYGYSAAGSGSATPEQQKSLKMHRLCTIALFLLAAGFLIAGLPQLATGLEWLGWGYFDSFTFGSYLIPGLAKVLGAVGLGVCSSHMSRALRQEKMLVTIAGNKSNISLRELSAAGGYGEKKTMQLTRDAVSHGLFGPAAYIDMRTQTLVIRGPAPQPTPAPKPASKPGQENKYQSILRQLHEVNDAIPGEEMSEKIDQLERISARIFELAEKDPQKKSQLNKFMDYYLPTSLKLLNTYATLDQQGMQGSKNVVETKASIESSMDLLVKAFAGQLDKLFQSDALDVSGDIAALQSMMSMDGLTDSDFKASPQNASADPKEHLEL